MKILFFAPGNSSHTIRLVNNMVEKEINIALLTFHEFDEKDFINSKYLILKKISGSNNINEGSIKKLFILLNYFNIKEFIKQYQPDILHVHYASSYGMLGAICGFHPYILSIWGSDIFSFPNKSFFHKMLLKFNLKNADKLLGTSLNISNKVKEFSNKNVEITPFGIDTEFFSPIQKECNEIIIGTIKKLDNIYGIDILIKAFASLKNKIKDKNIKLLIIGDGKEYTYYNNLVKELNIEEYTTFEGKVNYNDVVKYHNKIDIFINYSREESFGVSILEAMSCEKAVIASNVGGIPEIVKNNYNGLLIEKENINELKNAINRLIHNEKLRLKLGKNAREYVLNNYSIHRTVNNMINIYNRTISEFKK